jgi:hypothetical protein
MMVSKIDIIFDFFVTRDFKNPIRPNPKKVKTEVQKKTFGIPRINMSATYILRGIRPMRIKEI